MPNLFRAIRRRREILARDIEASVLLETGLVLSAALALAFYGFEVCMMTYTESVLNDAVSQAVRYAIVHGTDSSNCSGPSAGCGDQSGANVTQVVTQDARMTFHNMTNMQVSVTYPDGTSTPGSHVMVSAGYRYVPYVNYPGLIQNLGSRSEGVIVY